MIKPICRDDKLEGGKRCPVSPMTGVMFKCVNRLRRNVAVQHSLRNWACKLRFFSYQNLFHNSRTFAAFADVARPKHSRKRPQSPNGRFEALQAVDTHMNAPGIVIDAFMNDSRQSGRQCLMAASVIRARHAIQIAVTRARGDDAFKWQVNLLCIDVLHVTCAKHTTCVRLRCSARCR